MTRTAIIRAGPLVAFIVVAGCAGPVVTEGPGSPSMAPSFAGSGTPSSEPPSGALVLTRTGGFAGVDDVATIAENGTAQVTDRFGATAACTPDTAAVDRLRAIDLVAVRSAPSKPPIADGFSYTVTTAAGSASAGDGDDEGIRAEFVAAAAAVINSCLETRSWPAATSR